MIIQSLASALIDILVTLINAYTWVIIITALLSWVNPDPNNPIVLFLYRVAYPAYALIRRIPTRIGVVDLGPLLIILVLQFLRVLIPNLVGLAFQ